MKFTTIFFDLDDTIYPHESGLWEAIKARISQYMHEELGIGSLKLKRFPFATTISYAIKE